MALVRSSVFAVYARINDVLADDASRVHERRRRLHSSGKAIAAARSAYDLLVSASALGGKSLAGLKPLSGRMANFLDEAESAVTSKQVSSNPV